jgi:hypothetical protein
MEIYLGHTAEYWSELQKKVDQLNCEDLIEEIVELRGKVSFYESRIKECNNLILSRLS